MKRVAILGAGGMGTALAMLFARTARSVHLWARDPDQAREIAASRKNTKHLPDAVLPENVIVTPNACDATGGVDLIVVAIPSAYLRSTLNEQAERIPMGIPVLSVVKGIENETFARPSQIIEATLGPRAVSILSGPSHAEELAKGLPASVVVAGPDADLCVKIRDTLSQETFRVYSNDDAIGVELAGALKNLLGIAAGICDGLEFGDNAKASLLTRGLVEISRFGVAHGARPSTFYGLAGIGDMVTTCFSPFGRNRAVGEKVGRGQALDEVLAGMVNVAEGVPTTRSVYEQSQRLGIEMPITEELHKILFEAKPPRDAVTDLMVRVPKDEAYP